MSGAAMKARFQGKVVVVTGAAQGILRGVALAIAAEGGRVMLVDRAEFVHEVAAEAQDGRGIGFVADLETYQGAQAAVSEAITRFGRIDVGGAIRMRPFAEFEPSQIDDEIRRSLMPTLYSSHAVLPHMLRQGAGTIVNVSSNATRGIRRVPYSAAKGGINAVTTALAMEYGERGIRVVATAPGGTQAPPRRVPRNAEGDNARELSWMQEAIQQVIGSTFFKRYATLEEQIAPILFLASDDASYITGAVLPVAGGDNG